MVAKELHHVVEAIRASHHMTTASRDPAEPSVVPYVPAHVNGWQSAHIGYKKLIAVEQQMHIFDAFVRSFVRSVSNSFVTYSKKIYNIHMLLIFGPLAKNPDNNTPPQN